MKKTYKHFCGPRFPICLFDGTEVLDPYLDSNRLTQNEAIEILICQDPRRRSRSQDANEGWSLKYRK